jgi:TPR repeat protein
MKIKINLKTLPVLMVCLELPCDVGLSDQRTYSADEIRRLALDQEKIRLMAEQGDPDAQFAIGAWYLAGDGVSQDFQKALEWFLRSAEQGQVVAEYNVGVMYLGDESIHTNVVKAAYWLGKAADQGFAPAQYKLGVMHEDGDTGKPNLDQAAQLYLKAAEQGHYGAQFRLGLMCAQGKGVVRDNVEAFKWLSIAAAATPVEAEVRQAIERNLQNLKKFMTPRELTQARQSVASFVKKPMYPFDK